MPWAWQGFRNSSHWGGLIRVEGMKRTLKRKFVPHDVPKHLGKSLGKSLTLCIFCPFEVGVFFSDVLAAIPEVLPRHHF